jgi:micrococcal nuclease
MRRTLVTTALVIAVLALGGGKVVGLMSRPPSSQAVVERVVDGDTIVVRLDGREDRVRYIGIDTPESVKPGVHVQCYAKTASHENEKLVAGRTVKLVVDREERDRYGRLLAYVYRADDGLFVNAALVQGGYARTLTIAPNTAHEAEFAHLATQARAAGRGLWSRCG